MSKKNVLSYLGPGILMAGAAIGVSHLVQSTRAGADYGFSFIWIILLANLIKYPFFEFGARYTAATGETLLDGYKTIGMGYLVSFIVCSTITSIGSISAVTFVTAALLANMIPIGIPLQIWFVIILLSCLLMFISGNYSFMDRMIKILMSFLIIFTIIAFIMSLLNYDVTNQIEGFIPKEVFNMSSLPFIIAFMGWMPAPIEVSVWQSLWIKAKKQSQGINLTMREVLIDFNTGYILCVVLAIIFLLLGAFIMHGSGESFTNSAVGFASQIVNLYTSSIGKWTKPIISLIAFITMFSTTVTLLDAYPRSLGYSTKILLSSKSNLENSNSNKYKWIWTAILYILSTLIIYVFTSGLKTLIDVVTIIAFLTGPLFAFLNMKLIFSNHMPQEHRPKGFMKGLTFFGIIMLTLIALIFIISRFT